MLLFYECSIRNVLILYLNKQCSWLYSTKLISLKKITMQRDSDIILG